jgi:hypothetical protein
MATHNETSVFPQAASEIKHGAIVAGSTAIVYPPVINPENATV